MVTTEDLKHRLEVISDFCRSTNREFYLVLSSSVEKVVFSYFGGIRCSKDFVVLSIINLSQSHLIYFGSLIESYVSIVFVDTEKKHPFEQISSGVDEEPFLYYSNLLSEAHALFKSCKIVPWSPSRLTSEAAISTLRGHFDNDLSGKTISLVGPGSIGFKIAIGLVEEGATVHIYSKDSSKSSCLVSAINIVKSKYTIASAIQSFSLESCMTVGECVVLSASQDNFISTSHVLSISRKCSLVLDVGKCSLTRDALSLIHKRKLIKFQRLDISVQLTDMINVSCKTLKRQISLYNPKSFPVPGNSFVNYVSGGFPGSPGDIVVDDAESPTFQLGIVTELGQFLERFSLLS